MKNQLEIVCGPMFSGKTSFLLDKLLLFKELGYSVVYINHMSDTRNVNNYSSHNLLYNNTTLDLDNVKVAALSSFNPEKYDIIGIDEAQFFEAEMVGTIVDWVDRQNKYVIVCGLNGTFDRQKFGHVLDLIPFADSVIFKNAYCKECKNDTNTLERAIFTKHFSKSNNVIDIGGADKYKAVCRACFLKH
jgi:thymidine kinase